MRETNQEKRARTMMMKNSPQMMRFYPSSLDNFISLMNLLEMMTMITKKMITMNSNRSSKTNRNSRLKDSKIYKILINKKNDLYAIILSFKNHTFSSIQTMESWISSYLQFLVELVSACHADNSKDSLIQITSSLCFSSRFFIELCRLLWKICRLSSHTSR